MLVLFIPLYLLATLAIGFWASSRIKTSTDFTLAGKSLSKSFVGVTLFATWFGSSQIMGIPGDFVNEGFTAFVSLILSGAVCLFLVARFYARRLYRMNIVTVGDFFRIRFNRKLDMTVSVLMVMAYPHWIAAQFVALGYLFNGVLGIPIDYGILLGGVIVIVYTYIGGMWAVSYTDMLQSIMIVLGLIVLLIGIIGETDGIVSLFTEQPKEFFNLVPRGDLSSWSEYLALFTAFSIGAIPAQEIYQRVFSAKTERAAVYGLYLGGILLIVVPLIPMIIALAGAQLNPELMDVDGGQGIVPALVTIYSSTPVQVLFYGAMISAILSTSSGAMLAPATVIGENLIKPYIPGLSDKRLLLFTRLSVVLVAAASCYFAFDDADIVNLVAASLSLILVCIFAPFTFGLFWKPSSVFGAWTAIVSGGVGWFICFLMDTEIDPILYGTPLSCAGMIAGSLLRPDKSPSQVFEQMDMGSMDGEHP
jgi:SSS family transporter